MDPIYLKNNNKIILTFLLFGGSESASSNHFLSYFPFHSAVAFSLHHFTCPKIFFVGDALIFVIKDKEKFYFIEMKVMFPRMDQTNLYCESCIRL